MQLNKNILEAVKKLRLIETELNSQVFVERDLETRGLMLAIVAKTNVLLLGEPGVAKSLLAVEWKNRIKGAKYFEWLLNPFTTPEEIAGHISISSLQKDSYERNIEGTLNDAHIAFIDEVWKANSGVLNHMLPMLNERKYFNNGKVHKAPLLTLIGASNELPEEGDGLDAVLDRFVIKFNVRTIKEQSNWYIMMDRFLDSQLNGPKKDKTVITINEINKLQEAAKKIDIPFPVRRLVVDICQALKSENIGISPRVVNNSLRVIQANALINGRATAIEEDLEVLRHTFWKDPEEEPIIHSQVIQRITPEMKKVEELYRAAEEVFLNLGDLDSKSPQEVLDAIADISDIRKSMVKSRKVLKHKEKSTKQCDAYILKVKNMTSQLINGTLEV